ncbi:MAG: VanZ family protein [Acidobacteriota bacterium]
MGSARGRRPWLAWVLLGLWTLLIFASIPTMRALQRWVVAHLGSTAFGYTVVIAILAALAGALALGRRTRRQLNLPTVILLVAIAAISLWWTNRLWGAPEEAVHFIEYGALGVLAWRALRQHVPDASAHLAAALLTTLVGTADEIVQWVTPDRFWDLRDVGLNAGVSGLVQLALWKVVPPASQAVQASSLRLSARLAAAELCLLTLCLANTPARVERYAARFPALARLNTNNEAMAEYGHLCRDSAIGRFKSRLTPATLGRLDERRAIEMAAILDQYPMARYGEFLARIMPQRDPFLYEVRVHLFSRDHNLGEARQQPPGSLARRQLATAAFRENTILERYFGRTLAASLYAWSEALRARVEALVIPDASFTSKVGAHLITAFSEGTLRALLVVAVLGLLAASWPPGRRASQTTPASGCTPSAAGR